MKVYHILEDYSLHSGGIRTVVNDLTTHISVDSEISTIDKEENDINVKSFEASTLWKYSRELKDFLDLTLKEQKIIYHIHGMWMYPQYIASKKAIKLNKPFVITPHGMFEPWLWEQGTFKKKLYFNLLTKNNFKKANIIHAITEDEKNNLYKIFPKKSRIEVIPNLISTSIIPKIKESNTREKYILFLGRIHPKKGIKLLIKAFSKQKNSKFKLKIAGSDNKHTAELIEYVAKLGMSKTIEFVGMVTGVEKFMLYKYAHVFVAPSYSEVIGMVNLEAAIVGTPVITTYQTGLYKEWNNEGGILVNPNEDELKAALTKALSWSESERNDRGKKLKEFVEKNYSWERNAHKWEDLYRSLLAYS